MYAVKGGWVGQTFALAKSSDSGGKKSRIRRSKEDRKEMVESYIKRYQNSNNGNFPSLNLTHKEVGGSFYTVREIIREIIQENRVLGPAKPAEDGHKVDQFHEQYPLGSISIECQSQVALSSNETHAVSNDHQSMREELDSMLNGKVDNQLQRLVSNQYINDISVDKEYKESEAMEPLVQVNDDMLHTDIQSFQTLELMENIIEICTPKVTSIETDVVVETFPINSVSKITQDMNGRSVEAGELQVNMELPETKRVEVKPELSESGYSGPLDEKSVEHLTDQLFETLKSSTAISITRSTSQSVNPQADVAVKDGLTLVTTNQDLAVAVMEPKPAPINAHSKNSNYNSSNRGESLSQEVAAIKTKSDRQNAFSTEEGKNSTLNRSKLESWEGSSRRTGEPDTNPFLAVFQAFISAFVKFLWE